MMDTLLMRRTILQEGTNSKVEDRKLRIVFRRFLISILLHNRYLHSTCTCANSAFSTTSPQVTTPDDPYQTLLAKSAIEHDKQAILLKLLAMAKSHHNVG
jgi:hypothetical protein